jgi:hypothetical protein
MVKTPQIVERDIARTLIYSGSVSKRIVNRWNFSSAKPSILNIKFSLVPNFKIVKNSQSNILVQIRKSSSQTVSSFNLSNAKLSDSKTLNLDAGDYHIFISATYSIEIKYNFTFGLEFIQTPTGVSGSKKYALIVSVSDYLYISDLSYCDEDAVAWCDFLTQQNYSIILLGDKTSTYKNYVMTDLATEANIKKYMKSISSKVKSPDTFVFVSSGHGSGDGFGNSYICCLDMTASPVGQYTDKELALDVKLFTDAKAKVILFFDNCFSGGMIPEIVGLNPKLVCATSTCRADGYGFDVDKYKHGAWTYHFLVKTLLSNPTLPVNDLFTRALISYPYKNENLPQLGGNGSLKF